MNYPKLLFVGHQFIPSGLNSVTALTVPTGATVARIVAETQAVRYRQDGTDPTSSAGMPLAVNTERWFFDNLAALEFIEQAASAKLNIEYYKYA